MFAIRMFDLDNHTFRIAKLSAISMRGKKLLLSRSLGVVRYDVCMNNEKESAQATNAQSKIAIFMPEGKKMVKLATAVGTINDIGDKIGSMATKNAGVWTDARLGIVWREGRRPIVKVWTQ
jgi:hypothetical protein